MKKRLLLVQDTADPSLEPIRDAFLDRVSCDHATAETALMYLAKYEDVLVIIGPDLASSSAELTRRLRETKPPNLHVSSVHVIVLIPPVESLWPNVREVFRVGAIECLPNGPDVTSVITVIDKCLNTFSSG